MAVDEDSQARRLPRAVARHGHVHPFADGQRLGGCDRGGVARPEVDQRPAEVAVSHQELVAPTARIGPCLRAVKHDRAIKPLRRLEPQRHGERLAAAEVADRRRHRMVAGEPDRPAVPAVGEQDFFGGLGGLFGAQLTWKRAVGTAVIEGVANDLARDHAPGGLEGGRQRCRAGDPACHRGTRDRLCLTEIGRRFAARFIGFGQRCNGGVIEEPQLGCGDGLREVRIQPRLVHVVEEREELIKFLLRKRVELVVVAPAALEREPEERRAKGSHAVVDIVDAVFLLDRAPLVLLLVKPAEGRGEQLLVGGMREEVARHLPERELVPGEVLVEGLDYPVTPGPHRGPRAVGLEAVAVGVAGEIHPVGGHPLAIPRACQEPVEELFVGIGRRVGQECLNLGGRGRQAGDVEGSAADQRGSVGFGLGLEPTLREFGSHEAVDRMVVSLVAGRHVGLGCRHKRPVRLILCPFGDPTPEELHLLVREAADLSIGRRHHAVGIVGDDPRDELAGGRVFRNDRPRAAFQLGDGLLGDVEPQAGLPIAAVGTVAGEAVFGKDRPDVAVEREPRGPRGRRSARDRRRERGRGENCHDSWEGVRRHTK